jgi:DNA-binding LytR/AlgR family response regulator
MEKLLLKYLKPIAFKTPMGFDYFYYEEIIMIEADGNCSNIYAINRDGKTRVLHNLAYIESKYCKGSLYRCHKSFIINIIHIEKLELRACEIHLRNSFIVPLSRDSLRYIKNQSKTLL